MHVCDVFDALRTRRPYRDAWETERALTYIEERAGTEFEPEAATAFVAMMRKAETGIQLSPMPEAGGGAGAPIGNNSADSPPQPASPPAGQKPEGSP